MVENNYLFENDIDPPFVSATLLAPEDEAFDAPPAAQHWSCPQCTLLNPSEVHICGACDYCNVIQAAETAVNTYLENPTLEEYERAKVAAVHTGYACHATAGNGYHASRLMTEDNQNLETKFLRRRHRRMRMAAGGGVGLVVGTILLCGPIGTVVGGMAGAAIARGVSKRCERKRGLKMMEHAQARDIPEVKAAAPLNY